MTANRHRFIQVLRLFSISIAFIIASYFLFSTKSYASVSCTSDCDCSGGQYCTAHGGGTGRCVSGGPNLCNTCQNYQPLSGICGASGFYCGYGTQCMFFGSSFACTPSLSSSGCIVRSAACEDAGGNYKNVIYATNCSTPTPTPTSTPTPPPPKPPTISQITAIDTFQNNTQVNGGDVKPEGDSVTGSVSVSSTISYTTTWILTVVDTNKPTSTASYANNGNAYTFSLNPIGGDPVTDLFSFNLRVSARNAAGTSSTSTLLFYATAPKNFQCGTPATGTLLASDNTRSVLTLFDNNPSGSGTTPCQTGYFTGVATNTITTSGVYNNPTYNGRGKDSILYYPGYDNVVLLSTVGSNDIWIVTWNWSNNTSIHKIVQPGTVRATQLINNFPGQTVDMTLDASNLFISITQGYVIRISFATINASLNGWINNPGVLVTPINGNLAAYQFLHTGYMSVLFGITEAQTNLGFPLLYVAYINNSTGDREIQPFNASGGNHPAPYNGLTYKTQMGNSFNGGNLVFNGKVILIQGRWGIDGMTIDASGNIYAVTDYGRVIFVIAHADWKGGTPTLGVTYTDDVPNPAPPSPPTGFDGAEVDGFGQLYVATYAAGIYSFYGPDVVAAAIANNLGRAYSSSSIYMGYKFHGNLYYPTQAGVSWDDIAPLYGYGSAQQHYSPYYITRMGNTFSQGGYNIKQLSNNTQPLGGPNPRGFGSNPAYFSEYGLLSDKTNVFSNGGYGSFYNWEFQYYPSYINHDSNGNLSNVYGFGSLNHELCGTGVNTCTQLAAGSFPSNTIDANTNNLNSGIYQYTDNTTGATLSINADNGGLTTDGILLVYFPNGGTITITADHQNDFANTTNRLLLITNAVVDIKPTSYYTNTGPGINQFIYQYLDMGILTDSSLTVDPYPAVPNFIQGMKISGMLLSYSNIQFLLDIGDFNQWYPAVETSYDPSYITKFSHFFTAAQNKQEVGL